MQELQRTLAELEREEREMAAQRLTGQQHKRPSSRNSVQTGSTYQIKQVHEWLPHPGLINHLFTFYHFTWLMFSSLTQTPSASPKLLEKLLEENSELTERVTLLSQEKTALKHRLAGLEQELRRTENELAKVTAETENRPITDMINNSKVGENLHISF